jgi:hypothetical protein
MKAHMIEPPLLIVREARPRLFPECFVGRPTFPNALLETNLVAVQIDSKRPGIRCLSPAYWGDTSRSPERMGESRNTT